MKVIHSSLLWPLDSHSNSHLEMFFCGIRETGESGKHLSSRLKTKNKLHKHNDESGTNTKPQWWETSALTSVPPSSYIPHYLIQNR